MVKPPVATARAVIYITDGPVGVPACSLSQPDGVVGSLHSPNRKQWTDASGIKSGIQRIQLLWKTK